MPLYVYSPFFLGIAATGDFDIDYCETKISSRSTIIKTNAVLLNAKDLKFSETFFSVSDFRGYSAHQSSAEEQTQFYTLKYYIYSPRTFI